jgi:hypothetical protein
MSPVCLAGDRREAGFVKLAPLAADVTSATLVSAEEAPPRQGIQGTNETVAADDSAIEVVAVL